MSSLWNFSLNVLQRKSESKQKEVAADNRLSPAILDHKLLLTTGRH